MRKISQQTKLDEQIRFDTTKSYYPPAIQHQLFKSEKEVPIIEKPFEPKPINLPQLQEEHLKVRKLNEKELEILSDEIQHLYDSEKRYYYIDNKGERNTLENIYFLNKNFNSLPDELKQLISSENKKLVLEKYNLLLEKSKEFNKYYLEANEFSKLENPINLKNITYQEFFINLSRFVAIEITKNIGYLFGYEAHPDVIDFIGGKQQSFKIFDITSLNIETKINYIDTIIIELQKTIDNYIKRRKLLKKLDKEIKSSVDAFLSRADNINFLKWMDLNYPALKEGTMSSIIGDIKSTYSTTDSTIFRVGDLIKIKTYLSIYYKVGNYITNTIKSKIMSGVESEIEETIRDIFSDKFIKKTEELKNIFDNIPTEEYKSLADNIRTLDLDQLPNLELENDVKIFLDFVKKQYNLDLRSVFNFVKLKFFTPGNEALNKKLNFGFMVNSLYFLKQNLSVDYKNVARYTLINISDTVVKNIYKKYNIHQREYIIPYKELEKLTVKDIDEQINLKIKELIIGSLPGFKTPVRGYHSVDAGQTFSAISEPIIKSGKVSIQSFFDYYYPYFQNIPPQFVLHLIKQMFKNDRLTSFDLLDKLDRKHSQHALSILSQILHKNNKFDINNFYNYFVKYIQDISVSFAGVVSNVKNIPDKDAENIVFSSIRSVNTIEQDIKTLSEFISFIHNEAGSIPKEKLIEMIDNNNFHQFVKSGIAKKLFKSYASVVNLGGLKNILKNYGTVLTQLKRKNFISKNFSDNIKFIVSFFETNQEINPSKENFKQIFDITSSIETDLTTLQMGDALKEMLTTYTPKDKNLFKLDYSLNDKLRFRVLKDKDPRILRIGIETNCCQRIGGVGEVAARDSFVNPMAGILILEWKDEDQWKILSQSYFHYIPDDNSYILDNVEANYKNINESGLNLDEIYAFYAEIMKNKLKLKYFISGKSYSKINENKFKTHSMQKDPRKFDDRALTKNNKNFYSDFDERKSIDLLNPKFKLDNVKNNIERTLGEE